MEPHIQKLIEQFQLADKDRKLRLITEIASVKDEGILQFLVTCLGDETWLVRKMAADLIFEYQEAALPALSAALNSYSEDIQHWALQVLTRLGKKGAPSILRGLKSPNHDVRYFACMALGDLREPQGVTPLIRALGDETWHVRKAASDALVKYGEEVISAIEAVMNKTTDEDVRFWAIKSLGKLGPKAQRILLESLRTGDKHLRYVIAAALGESGDRRVIKVLIDSLGDPDWTIRKSATQALAEIGENAVDMLIEGLKEPAEDVRDGCMTAIFRIGDAAIRQFFVFVEGVDDNTRYLLRKSLVKLGTRVVEPLIRLFKSTKPEVMVFCAATLGEIGTPKAVPVLIEGLSNKDWNVRRSCAYALTEIGEKGVDRIADALTSTNEDTRYWVTRILESIGEPGMPYLVKALSDKNKNIRYFAARALGSSSNPDVMRDLIRSLADTSWSVRKAAAESIIKLEAINVDHLLRNISNDNSDIRFWISQIIRQTGVDLLEQIHERVRTGDPEMRLCACQALSWIADARSTDVLVDALRDGNEWSRIYAAIALGQIGDPRAITPLLRSMSDRNTEVRRNILQAFERLGPKVFETIAKSVESTDVSLRRNSAIALGEMRAVQGLDHLIMLSEDPEDKVRQAAVEALGHFNSARVLPILIKALNDSSFHVRQAAGGGLAEQAFPESIHELIALIHKAKDERDQRLLRRTMSQIAAKIPQSFIALFAHESVNIRTLAAEALIGAGLPVLQVLTEAESAAHERKDETTAFWCQKVYRKIKNPQEPLPNA